MTEQLISFGTAKLAEDKGFNIPCGKFYLLDQYSEPSLANNKGLLVGETQAPTQSSLQKWLREKYKIHIHICYFSENKKWNVDLYKYETTALLNHPLELSNNTSYEEALEVGLQEALKLIKK